MARPLSIKTLRQAVAYDPGTGQLTWLMRDAQLFGGTKRVNAFNTRFSGKAALATPDKSGYLYGEILGKSFKAHRVAWAISKGRWPKGDLDHRDRNPANNKLDNLREASRQQNCRNQSMSKLNTSGHCGVSWSKQARKWWAQIGVGGKLVHLGLFSKIDDAVAARRAAEARYCFSAGHGSPRHN